MKFSELYTTSWHDTDACRHVRPSALLVYMQETSNKHIAALGMPLDELRDTKNLAYILSKIRLEIYRPLTSYEDIKVETWTVASRGFSSIRCYRILCHDEIVADAETTWALIDTVEKNLHRPEESGYAFENEDALILSAPSRTRAPSDCVFEQVGSRKIVYSDLDYNMHMNNTRYPDMLCDHLPLEEVGRIGSITLSYLHEAAFGQTVSVFRAKKDDLYFFKTVNDEGTVCLEAVIKMRG